MVNGKTPFYLMLVAAALLLGAVLLIQPYTADFPGTDYAEPARRFLRAAVRQDSADLQGMAGSRGAVDWALQAARTHPDTLAAWAGRTQTFVTSRRADTSEVLVYPVADPCREVPIVLRFIGSGNRARVVQARSACLPTTR